MLRINQGHIIRLLLQHFDNETICNFYIFLNEIIQLPNVIKRRILYNHAHFQMDSLRLSNAAKVNRKYV